MTKREKQRNALVKEANKWADSHGYNTLVVWLPYALADFALEMLGDTEPIPDVVERTTEDCGKPVLGKWLTPPF